ncbi:MAG: hypothetical protein CMH53_09615 [Myxococcales bacterium]|nr:hypothetical protein [Myxococcales bacterium]
MDDVFIRELVIFLGVCGLFIGTVPVLLRGHKVAHIEDTLSGAASSADADGAAASAVNSGAQQVRVSKKRRARARASNRKSS